jgi:DNA-binding response OmpR family regulator
MSNTDLPHRVLIVDDEKSVCDTLLAVFTKSGYEARTAISAESAIEVVAQWEPHLAILDVDLPQMNGIDLAVALKSGHPSCCVLLFSGHPRTLDLLAEAEAEGHIFEVIAKPTHPTVLLDKVFVLLSRDLHEVTRAENSTNSMVTLWNLGDRQAFPSAR